MFRPGSSYTSLRPRDREALDELYTRAEAPEEEPAFEPGMDIPMPAPAAPRPTAATPAAAAPPAARGEVLVPSTRLETSGVRTAKYDPLDRSPEELEYLQRAEGVDSSRLGQGIASTLGSVADLFLTKGKNVKRIQARRRAYAESQGDKADKYRKMAEYLRGQRKQDVRYTNEQTQQAYEHERRARMDEAALTREQKLTAIAESREARERAADELAPKLAAEKRDFDAAEAEKDRQARLRMQSRELGAQRNLAQMRIDAEKGDPGAMRALQETAARDFLAERGVTDPSPEVVDQTVKSRFPTSTLAERFMAKYTGDVVTTGARHVEKEADTLLASETAARQWEQAIATYGSIIENASPEVLTWAKFGRNQGAALPAGVNSAEAQKVAQAIDQLSNVVAHEQFGASQTGQEVQRHFRAMGADTTADPALIKGWVQQARTIAADQRALQRARTTPQALERADARTKAQGVGQVDLGGAKPEPKPAGRGKRLGWYTNAQGKRVAKYEDGSEVEF